jgi:PBSX family phage portal protein
VTDATYQSGEDLVAARDIQERLTTILKATVVGRGVADPTSRPGGEETASLFSSAGAIEPPYDPETLCVLFEHSNSLRPNIDAYSTNVDGFGHRLEPMIDFDAEDAARKVADCIRLERAYAAGQEASGEGEVADATEEEIAAAVRKRGLAARTERARLEAFFDGCCSEVSFVDLRRVTRQDLEVTGNAYWEVMRNGAGQIARLVHVPSYTVRLLPLDREPVEVRERVRTSPVAFDTVMVRRRLRRFVQVQAADRVFFKSLGDPRTVSRKTGRAFATLEAMRAEDPNDAPANELVHFRTPSPRSPYGVPRWIGALLSVLGSREAEEVNYLWFSQKTVPPLAFLVSNGRLSEGSVPRLERFVEENLKGKANFWRALVLEVDSASSDGRAKVEIKPLINAQLQDATHNTYDERNIDKVGAAFRIPRLLRGDGRDFNRATAEAALRFAEDQVFQPERESFDHWVNRTIFADLGIRYWRFKSNAPLTRDPERMSEMVERLVRVGVLVPEEGRQLAGDIFNREFPYLGDDWTRRPITLTLAGIQSQTHGPDGQDDAPLQRKSLLDGARWLLALREELAAEEARATARRLELARRYVAEPTTAAGEDADHAD